MLHVHRGERADALAGALADLLAAPPDDPLAPEVVAVPTRGVERWLAQTLATRLGAGGAGTGDGVAANLRFPFPGRLVGQALAAATGLDPADDPWRPERLAWPLLGVVDALAADPRLAPVRGQLTGPGRLTAVRHVADLFDRYGVHRPALLLEWARADPGEGWQPLLWRGLRDRLGVASPAERVGPACARLREDPALADLPARFAVFGLTRLPATYLEVLRALAAARDAHLFLLHPSPALWSAVEARRGAAPASGRRADDGTAHLARNPLLASWGRDAREMQLIMGGGDGAGAHHAGPAPADTLLGRLQADVRADRPPGQGAGPLPCLDPGDRSVQVHACHGRVRQVEVLRDAVLHLMQEDPTLEPRDVIVMCPDVEAFAPLVTAVLGGDGSGPSAARPPDLRVRLADRSLRQTNPLLGVVAEVLAMAGGRAGASEVLSLAGRPPVRRRFALDEDDLATLAGWVAATGVRWGLDAAHRAAWDLDGVAEGTWRAGLDRILLGAAMADEEARLVGGVLPLDEVGAQGADLAGRLAELVTRLGDAMRDLDAGPRPLHEWAAAITAAADALAEAAPHEAWQREELGRLLAGAVEEAGGAEDPVDLDEVRHLLADRLRGRPTRANFRTGHLTVCTLVPMRSVPHRVVCLMGLDDGAFPRAGAPDGDDLLAGDPHVGDRDVRGEDRQLLLDALMAAGSHLVVTYAGRDERTNAPLPPAVPVGELLDQIARTARGPGGGDVRAHVVTDHPLQPFDPRAFTPAALSGPGPWSFDPVALEGARALTGPRAPRAPFLAGPLGPWTPEVVELALLERFVQAPVAAFLRERLGVRADAPDPEAADALPLELDPLGRYGVGMRMLEGRLAGVPADACRAAEVARGLVPPGGLADAQLAEIAVSVEWLWSQAVALGVDGAWRPAPAEVDVVLPGGRRLVGVVPGVVEDVVCSVSFARVTPKRRLVAWVRLLALTATHPGRPLSALTLGRLRPAGPRGRTLTRARLRPPEGGAAARRAWATTHLGALVDLLERGMREPLPLVTATSAWLATGHPGRARSDFEGGWESPGERDEPAHALVLGDGATLDDLLGEPPRGDEAWGPPGASRAEALAARLWEGLLAHESMDHA